MGTEDNPEDVLALIRAELGNRTPCSEPEELTSDEAREAFPFVFAIDFNYLELDTMAGIWEAVGLETEILQTGVGYALVLHHPMEAE